MIDFRGESDIKEICKMISEYVLRETDWHLNRSLILQ